MLDPFVLAPLTISVAPTKASPSSFLHNLFAMVNIILFTRLQLATSVQLIDWNEHKLVAAMLMGQESLLNWNQEVGVVTADFTSQQVNLRCLVSVH